MILFTFFFTEKNTNTVYIINQHDQSVFKSFLERIADFLLPGEGIWWYKEGNKIIFKDGDGEKNERNEGPTIIGYEEHNLQSSTLMVQGSWDLCMKNGIILPLDNIKRD